MKYGVNQHDPKFINFYFLYRLNLDVQLKKLFCIENLKARKLWIFRDDEHNL